MLRLLKFFLSCLIFSLVCAVAAFSWIAWRAFSPLAFNAPTPLEFRIPPGSSLRGVAAELNRAGVDCPPWLFILAARAQHAEGAIKAGSYEIEAGLTPWLLIQKFSRGDVSQSEIVFIEGWTLRQMRQRLDAHPDLRHDTAQLSDAELMRLILSGTDGENWAAEAGMTNRHGEGLLFPDTYLFVRQSSDLDVLRRAHRMLQSHLRREWSERARPLPYRSPYEALIMASIIEKETGQHGERAQIATVFVNRLRLGMLLQTDPTVIYGIGESFDGNLRKADLQRDTPYNTYTRLGLPPTPIAMPSLASLRAALHPAPGNALYFVARGDGTSHFSTSLEEHNRAVNRYQRRGKRE
ncbi:MAG: endolytic transglycosylase MltG [Betaproteobacteria bacterium]|nr:endolytic transglycosylase MltG [Betaproteobacteria bacterium]